jgi:Raf kinase inhibitor-like YbhB/YbcL family protein
VARRSLLVVLALAGLLTGACSHKGGGQAGSVDQRAPTGMTVTSPAFENGGTVPERYSCEGENVPPALRWRGTPAGTAQLAVVVEDPDAPRGPFVHWIVVGIDPATTALDADRLPPGATVLEGSSDNPTYIGPCPPNGDKAHRYSFDVYALPSRGTVAGRSPVERVRAIRREATAGGRLTGRFAR